MHSDSLSGATAFPDVRRLWFEILGGEAQTELGFLANGGDSFHAVLFASKLFDITGQEIDYLDIIDAQDLAAIERLISESDAAGKH
ncbi:hypothetical protein [Streptomyces lavendofoliae]|uniref:hypothetical protein n=1 Tax=Streptomyces lavendofoliae TaxID=67314 RepID=UPI003D920E41